MLIERATAFPSSQIPRSAAEIEKKVQGTETTEAITLDERNRQRKQKREHPHNFESYNHAGEREVAADDDETVDVTV